MKVAHTSFIRYALAAFSLALAFLNLECSLPNYDSPQPGSIEIRLHSISTRIPFSPLNSFIITLTEAQAVRDDHALIKIYQDVKSIARKPSVYNTLDLRAHDSSLVMGKAFVPPGHYVGINLLLAPDSSVIWDGYRVITVDAGRKALPPLSFAGSFDVKENTTTQITLTVNLDSTLQKGADKFYFRPLYYISSIK